MSKIKKQEEERFNYLYSLTTNTVKKRNYSLQSIHLLDEENVLVFVVNSEYDFETIHYRLKNSRLVEVNSWNHMNSYVNVINDLNLVMLGGRE